ncbi:MAG: FKBP-type peptidyl-prolyl cis-trans isomerase [Planctomycetota bacterium]
MRLNRSVLTLSTALVLVCGSLIAMKKQPPAPPTPVPAKQPEIKPPAVKIDPKAPVQYEGPDGTLYKVIKTGEIKLVMEDLKLGDGAEAKANSTITIHYHGTLASTGKVFDSTRAKEPATFPLDRLIQGWQLGIPGMKVGGVRRLTIPWQFAYGERGAGGDIPPRADLVFSIELTAVN